MDGTVKVWDRSAGALERTFDFEDEVLASVAFSPDGISLAYDADDRLLICEWKNDNLTHSFPGQPRGYAGSLAFSPSGKLLAAGFSNGFISIADLDKGSFLSSFEADQGSVYVAFSPDGRHIAYGSNDRKVKLWNVAEQKLVKSLEGHGHIIESLAFSADGRLLASGSNDETVRVWDYQRAELHHTFKGHGGLVHSLSFSHEGKRVLSASGDMFDDGDNTIRIWDLAKKGLSRTLRGHSSRLRCVAYSPDSKIVAYGGYRKITLWDCAENRPIRSFKYRSHDEVQALRFSHDGKYLVWATHHGAVVAMEIDTGSVNSFADLDASINKLTFSPDGKYLAACSGDTWEDAHDDNVKLWDFHQRKLIHTFTGHTRAVVSSAFSPDGKSLVSCAYDGTVRLWNIEKRMCVGEFLKKHEGLENRGSNGLLSLCFSRDGSHVIGADSDGRIVEWETLSGVMLSRIKGHKGGVRALAISSCGKYLASDSEDCTIKLWDSASKELLRTLSGHGNVIEDLTFSPDGSHIASVSFDGTMRIWPLEKVQSTLQGEAVI
jgi:WD40 repeat protein